jgi:hypothetical protein
MPVNDRREYAAPYLTVYDEPFVQAASGSNLEQPESVVSNVFARPQEFPAAFESTYKLDF